MTPCGHAPEGPFRAAPLAALPHCLIAAILLVSESVGGARLPVETLRPTASLPARLVENIESPRAYVETSTGISLVLDGGAQAVYAINAARSASRRIVQVGTEDGHLMNPSGFSLGPNDIFAVTDMPGQHARLQYFGDDGRLISRFWLANQPGARQALGRISLGGAGALAFTGRTFLINAPAAGALINEYNAAGEGLRSIGRLRSTGQESDAAVHAMLNTGVPLVDPTGGYYFVFDTGVPLFRKYDASGQLVFERHVEGIEIDAALRSMPASWPSRGAAAVPYAPGLIHAAAVSASGQLWIAVSSGHTYIYDGGGDKIRTVRFEAAGSIAPTSFFFAKGDRLLVTPGCYEFPAGSRT